METFGDIARQECAAVGPKSVATMTKHFPWGGPQQGGEDLHFAHGREQVYPGGNFEYHLTPFLAAFEADLAQLTEPFVRASGRSPSAHEGHGLGLSLVSEIVDRFGGTLGHLQPAPRAGCK